MISDGVEISGVSKQYLRNKQVIQALKEISLSIPRGQLFGLIGPDGAGKTTLFRILTTLLIPDQGTVTVAGLSTVKDYRRIRREVGYMPGKFSLYQDLTVAENLEFFATVFNTTLEANYDMIKDIYVQIEPFRKRRAGALSGGMKQKLALCCALVHKPSFLFLDEPTTGVDPVSRKEFWGMLRKLKQQDITIMVSTPYMDEANLCDRIAFLMDGKILTTGTPDEITLQYRKPLLSVRSADMGGLLKDLREYPQTDSCYAFGSFHHLTLRESHPEEAALRTFLATRGHLDISITTIPATVEDCFMALSGSNAERV